MESQIKNFSSFAFAISMLKHSFFTMRREHGKAPSEMRKK